MGQDGSRRGEGVAAGGREAVIGRQGGVRRCAVGARVLHAGSLHLRCGGWVWGVGRCGRLVALEVWLAVRGCD